MFPTTQMVATHPGAFHYAALPMQQQQVLYYQVAPQHQAFVPHQAPWGWQQPAMSVPQPHMSMQWTAQLNAPYVAVQHPALFMVPQHVVASDQAAPQTPAPASPLIDGNAAESLNGSTASTPPNSITAATTPPEAENGSLSGSTSSGDVAALSHQLALSNTVTPPHALIMMVPHALAQPQLKRPQIIVNYLPAGMNGTELAQLFRDCGAVCGSKIVYDKENRSRCFGFVYFADLSAALTAIRTKDNLEVQGKIIRVQFSDKPNNNYP